MPSPVICSRHEWMAMKVPVRPMPSLHGIAEVGGGGGGVGEWGEWCRGVGEWCRGGGSGVGGEWGE